MNRSIHMLQANYHSVKNLLCSLPGAHLPPAPCCQTLPALHMVLNTSVYMKNLKILTYNKYLVTVSFKNCTEPACRYLIIAVKAQGPPALPSAAGTREARLARGGADFVPASLLNGTFIRKPLFRMSV